MRQEADFWNSQSNQFHKWPDVIETYGCAFDAMPPFPSQQLNGGRSPTTLSVHGSVSQVNYYPEFFIDINAYQLIPRMLSPSSIMYHKPRSGYWRLSLIYKNCE